MTQREFGAVRRLPSGRWQAKYRHPRTNEFIVAPTHVRLNVTATWLAGIQRDLESGTWMDPAWSAVSLENYATTWLAQRTLRPRTVELYEGLLDRYILPDLGTVELGELSPRDVRSWHAELLRRGRPGPVTVAKAYRLLRTICETAVSDEMIGRNPCNIKGAAVEHFPERPGAHRARGRGAGGRHRGALLPPWCSSAPGAGSAWAMHWRSTRVDVDLEEVASVRNR